MSLKNAHFDNKRMKMAEMKAGEPDVYYFQVIKGLAEKFPGVHLEYKVRKRPNSEGYLAKQERSFCDRVKHCLNKVRKNLIRSLLFWREPSAGEKFLRANERTHLRFIEAEYWQHDETKWVYFMYLNLPLMIILFFGGFQMLFLDILLIFFVRLR